MAKKQRKTITHIQIAEPENNGTGDNSGADNSISDEQQAGNEGSTTDTAVKDPITIKKAKLEDDMFLKEVEYSEETKDGKNIVSIDCTALAHDDLIHSFHKLDNHLCRLTEQYDSLGSPDFKNTIARSFSIGGKGAKEGMVVSGYRSLDSGKQININTPFTTWDSGYEYVSELSEVIEECKHEVKQYLFNNKHKPEPQQELPFDKGYDPEQDPYVEEGL